MYKDSFLCPEEFRDDVAGHATATIQPFSSSKNGCHRTGVVPKLHTVMQDHKVTGLVQWAKVRVARKRSSMESDFT
jgi:hypothetical protein